MALPTTRKQNYIVGKIDCSFTPSMNLSVVLSKDFADQTSPDAFRLKTTTNDSNTEMLALTLTHSFTPTLVSTGHAGIYRTTKTARSPIQPVPIHFSWTTPWDSSPAFRWAPLPSPA